MNFNTSNVFNAARSLFKHFYCYPADITNLLALLYTRSLFAVLVLYYTFIFNRTVIPAYEWINEQYLPYVSDGFSISIILLPFCAIAREVILGSGKAANNLLPAK